MSILEYLGIIFLVVWTVLSIYVPFLAIEDLAKIRNVTEEILEKIEDIEEQINE